MIFHMVFASAATLVVTNVIDVATPVLAVSGEDDATVEASHAATDNVPSVHDDVPATRYPALQVVWHVVPEAIVALVQVPATPLVYVAAVALQFRAGTLFVIAFAPANQVATAVPPTLLILSVPVYAIVGVSEAVIVFTVKSMKASDPPIVTPDIVDPDATPASVKSVVAALLSTTVAPIVIRIVVAEVIAILLTTGAVRVLVIVYAFAAQVATATLFGPRTLFVPVYAIVGVSVPTIVFTVKSMKASDPPIATLDIVLPLATPARVKSLAAALLSVTAAFIVTRITVAEVVAILLTTAGTLFVITFAFAAQVAACKFCAVVIVLLPVYAIVGVSAAVIAFTVKSMKASDPVIAQLETVDPDATPASVNSLAVQEVCVTVWSIVMRIVVAAVVAMLDTTGAVPSLFVITFALAAQVATATLFGPCTLFVPVYAIVGTSVPTIEFTVKSMKASDPLIVTPDIALPLLTPPSVKSPVAALLLVTAAFIVMRSTGAEVVAILLATAGTLFVITFAFAAQVATATLFGPRTLFVPVYAIVGVSVPTIVFTVKSMKASA